MTKRLDTNSFRILDLTKFVGALLVVLIHTAPLEPYSAIANFYTRDVLARLAVPLFFAISGFFFARRPNPSKSVVALPYCILGGLQSTCFFSSPNGIVPVGGDLM